MYLFSIASRLRLSSQPFDFTHPDGDPGPGQDRLSRRCEPDEGDKQARASLNEDGLLPDELEFLEPAPEQSDTAALGGKSPQGDVGLGQAGARRPAAGGHQGEHVKVRLP